MRIPVVGLLVALVLAPGHPVAADEIGSFLEKPARSLTEFVAAVRRDRVLQQRYGKHLGIPWRTVPGHLASRLKPGVIAASAPFTVYNVTRDGSIYPTKQRLSAGTRIYRLAGSPLFFTQRGEPVRPFAVPVVRRVLPPKPAGPPPAPVVKVQRIEVPSE